MASHVFVVDGSFKRTQIKVNPGTYLREIVDEACRSRKWSPDQYALKTQNHKVLDLSQPFRLSGLSAGAKLQLVQASKSPGVVSVALQLPEIEGGGRLSDKFPSTSSIWLILRKYEDAVAGPHARKLNLTQRGAPSADGGQGRLMYEQPCLNVLGRNLDSFTDLQRTLAQLGLNGGTAMMRLSFKTTQTPLEEAMQEISSYFSSVEPAPATDGAAARQIADGARADAAMESSAPAVDSSALPEEERKLKQEPTEDASMAHGPTTAPLQDDAIASSSETTTGAARAEALPPPASSTQTDVPPLSQPPSNTRNGISVYRPPSSSMPAAALAPDDPSVFEPTVDHAKAHQAALNRQSQNKRLLSDKELEAQEAERQQKLATVQSVTVRVRYPDQSQIETTVGSTDTAAHLYAKVMDTLAAAPEPFELRFLGTKTHETLPNSSGQRLVKDLGFRGKVLVTLVWSPEASTRARQGPSLKEEYRSRATDLKVELVSQQATGVENHKAAMQKPETSGGGSGSGGKGKGDLEAKMKKFLGFGKK